jgi:hypothetical protein
LFTQVQDPGEVIHADGGGQEVVAFEAEDPPQLVLRYLDPVAEAEDFTAVAVTAHREADPVQRIRFDHQDRVGAEFGAVPRDVYVERYLPERVKKPAGTAEFTGDLAHAESDRQIEITLPCVHPRGVDRDYDEVRAGKRLAPVGGGGDGPGGFEKFVHPLAEAPHDFERFGVDIDKAHFGAAEGRVVEHVAEQFRGEGYRPRADDGEYRFSHCIPSERPCHFRANLPWGLTVSIR